MKKILLCLLLCLSCGNNNSVAKKSSSVSLESGTTTFNTPKDCPGCTGSGTPASPYICSVDNKGCK